MSPTEGFFNGIVAEPSPEDCSTGCCCEFRVESALAGESNPFCIVFVFVAPKKVSLMSVVLSIIFSAALPPAWTLLCLQCEMVTCSVSHLACSPSSSSV